MRSAGLLSLALAGLLAAACGGGGGESTTWSTIASSQPAALLAVWGASSSDVWVVGGDARTGDGPAAWHWDGTTWERHTTGVTNVDLWWVFGIPGGPVFFGGSGGTILRYEGGTFTPMTTPATQTVFGIWGANADDVWAVGGNFGGAGGAFAWRWDGDTWTASTEVPAETASQGTVFKVAGRAADDVWMSGTAGLALHFDGAALTPETVAGDDALFSVACATDRVVMVGGTASGVVAEYDGTSWETVSPEGAPLLSGVAVRDDDAVAVGREGAILRSGGGDWAAEGDVPTTENLHAAWIDETGGVWAVGGRFDQPRTEAGTLLYGGATPPGTF